MGSTVYKSGTPLPFREWVLPREGSYLIIGLHGCVSPQRTKTLAGCSLTGVPTKVDLHVCHVTTIGMNPARLSHLETKNAVIAITIHPKQGPSNLPVIFFHTSDRTRLVLLRSRNLNSRFESGLAILFQVSL